MSRGMRDQLRKHWDLGIMKNCLIYQKRAISFRSCSNKMDEPLGDGSLIPTYLLSKFTRNSVKVALSGDGGDELFAGYDPFRALSPACIYQRFTPTNISLAVAATCWLNSDIDRKYEFRFQIAPDAHRPFVPTTIMESDLARAA